MKFKPGDIIFATVRFVSTENHACSEQDRLIICENYEKLDNCFDLVDYEGRKYPGCSSACFISYTQVDGLFYFR